MRLAILVLASAVALAVGIARPAPLSVALGRRIPRPCRLPPRDCEGAHCADLVRFLPAHGLGYVDVQLPDERSPRHSTSYLRRDLRMAIRYAAAKVACVTRRWEGNRAPLALGDMSDRRGDTPGTARGYPRHPPGTHTRGRDIDIAYYQLGPDNQQRAICPHVIDGIDQMRCVGPPRLDVERTALFVAALFECPRVRVIGVDGRVGPPLDDALDGLCRAGLATREACARRRLTYETVDRGRGWFLGHHNHLHVSWRE